VITESFWNHPAVTSRTSISPLSVAGLVVTAVTAVALAGCGGASGTGRPAASHSATAAAGSGAAGAAGAGGAAGAAGSGAGAAAASPLPRATTQSECEGRPDSSGDILVRMTTNGQPAVTQQLGGAWNWDAKTRRCNTAVQAVMLTASGTTGDCTQVAYAASNPGYQLTTSPAPPLKKVLVAKGPAC
jgi:hypothetical protein